MIAETVLEPPAQEVEENAKCRQVIEGARKIFLARGFDAASMGDIAKAAGVSKGTLYVYFKDKDELFAALMKKECLFQAEDVFIFDPADADIAGTLTRLGVTYVSRVCEPGRQLPLRTVVAIADRMPNIGRIFYENGPLVGISKLRAYLEAQVAAGRLRVRDCEVAAAQLMEAYLATLFKPLLFNFAPPPTRERIEYVVGLAVEDFMAAHASAVS